MDIKKAMLDPGSVFDRPEDVLVDNSLTLDQKINILRRWEYDARELAVAEEENMGGGPPNVLPEILSALQSLHAGSFSEKSAPTKQ
ncbi:MAG TPA: hypothetical protein VJ974_08515 [Geopsychrobacteraceae bacterium]|nr:hypothetical protein [Geopsychrobacteraceae bacterium]